MYPVWMYVYDQLPAFRPCWVETVEDVISSSDLLEYSSANLINVILSDVKRGQLFIRC